MKKTLLTMLFLAGCASAQVSYVRNNIIPPDPPGLTQNFSIRWAIVSNTARLVFVSVHEHAEPSR
jgi:hypothetical protein